ncbi:MAG: AMP-binding protein [Cyanobacteria bacterium REEB67]|nr:AMP-binding protein [Cyanobacteria bacterium REEB67]
MITQDNSANLLSIIAALAAGRDRSAIVQFRKEDSQTWSYYSLAKQIRKLACGLRQRGIGPGDRVVLQAPPSAEWVIAALATIGLGGIVVPLDVQIDDANLRDILTDVEAKLFCTVIAQSNRIRPLLLGKATELVLLDEDEGHESWQHLCIEDTMIWPHLQAEDIAALFYTSGTMGAPKGVPLSHANLLYQISAIVDTHILRESDRLLAPLPLHHIYPFVVEMLLPLRLHLPVVIPESLTGPQLSRAIKAAEVTAIVGVPKLYNTMLNSIKDRANATPGAGLAFSLLLAGSSAVRRLTGLRLGRKLFARVHDQIGPKLRILACGGAALEGSLARSLEGLGWDIAIGYGLTETSPLLALKLPGEHDIDSVGCVLPGTWVKIDGQRPHDAATAHLKPVDKDTEPGEILARGPGIFKGYRNLPEKTAQAFTAEGWFKTGDSGYFKNGRLHVIGRISALIVGESGEKIDPELLEAHYMQNPLIKEIAILQRRSKLVGISVPDLSQIAMQGGGDVARLMHDAVDERSVPLPRYKRLTAIMLCPGALPRTPMGKLQRYKLAGLFESIKKGNKSESVLTWQDLPHADQEMFSEPIAQGLWQFIAERFPGQRLNLDSSIQLDLGIDSLEWMALSLDIREHFGIELDESTILNINTIRDLIAETVKLSKKGLNASTGDLLLEPEKQLSSEQRRWLAPLNSWQTILQISLYTFDKVLMACLFREKVRGLENIPQDRPVIFIPNHASYLDGFVLAAALPYARLKQLQWTGWTGIAFANKYVRSLSRLLRGIPIDPDRAVVSSLALAAAVLKSQQSLTWFPEGRRTLTGDLQPFKGGIGILLEHFPDAVVVPVFLNGTGRALAPGAWLIKPIQIEVIFGEAQAAFDLMQKGSGESARDRIVSALYEAVWNLDPRHKQSLAREVNAQTKTETPTM